MKPSIFDHEKEDLNLKQEVDLAGWIIHQNYL